MAREVTTTRQPDKQTIYSNLPFNQNRSYRNILYRLYIFDKTLTAGRTFRNVATIFKHGTYSSDDMSFGTMHSISVLYTHMHACTL